MLSRIIGAVAHASEAMEADGPGQPIASFAFVQLGGRMAAQ